MSSSGPEASSVFKSNQLGILKPELRVTGIVGAVGQTTFTWAGFMAAIALAHPWLQSKQLIKSHIGGYLIKAYPVSPNPWRKISWNMSLNYIGTPNYYTEVIVIIL